MKSKQELKNVLDKVVRKLKLRIKQNEKIDCQKYLRKYKKLWEEAKELEVKFVLSFLNF